MSDLWYEDYAPDERSGDLKRRYTMPSIGATDSDDAAVDVDGISDWTSLQDAWGTSSFESRATGAPRAVSEIEAYSSPGLGTEYAPRQPGSYGRSYGGDSGNAQHGAYGRSYGGGSEYASGRTPGYDAASATGYYATSAPSYYATSGPSATEHATGGPSSAMYDRSTYSLGNMYDENRVSCSECNWVLEDKSWCCDRDCNDPNGGHYRQAYVCADPSDKTGKLTSRCEVDTECLADQPPTLCSSERLLERQRGDTRDDPACATWRGRTSRPVGTQPWQTPASTQPWQTPASTQPWQTPAGTQPWQTPASTQPWQTPASTQFYSPTAPWLGNAS